LPGEIIMKNFCGYWSEEDLTKPSLSNINLHFEKQHLYGICGRIGSGKTGLINAILR
jgi:ABC-type lipoprotein export system ATPase subunit